MAAKTAGPFPILPPNLLTPPSRRPITEVRFSRWNNANAEPFLRRRREQKEIEDDLRRHRRYKSATRIAEDWGDDAPAATSSPPNAPAEFRSRGTPSAPSRPSIPGKASKYSKPPPEPAAAGNSTAAAASHPAFRRLSRVSRGGTTRLPLEAARGRPEVTIGEDGVSYRIADAPFEFQYSYTETPKVKPLALREPPVVPFGPATMPRPWTGRKPLPASKKNLPEFDSFRPPPPGKKGVKPVQAPGPFLGGSGPKYHAASRKEILGEPLTKEEVTDLIKACIKTKRQLNIGRDGLTHNMLDNMHAHWKRRRVCKIKCKGVCTVDMDNVRQQLEEKTGGKIIYSRGGVIFLFRGRNYNYRTRPRFPLMLWKPVSPVYPRLVQRVPEGLTLEEATELRTRGRKVPPICKLGKNGVYFKLVKGVKEAFEECDLVRINCQGLNRSDTRKIGAKLKDLVPCILLSFQFEHILFWRGKDWKSSLSSSETCKGTQQPDTDATEITSVNSTELLREVHEEILDLEGTTESSDEDPRLYLLKEDTDAMKGVARLEKKESHSSTETSVQCMTSPSDDPAMVPAGAAPLPAHYQEKLELVGISSCTMDLQLHSEVMPCVEASSSIEGMNNLSTDGSSGGAEATDNQLPSVPSEVTANGSLVSMMALQDVDTHQPLADSSSLLTRISAGGSVSTLGDTSINVVEPNVKGLQCQDDMSKRICLEGVTALLKQAIENGSAVILDNESLDANTIHERVTKLSKTAPMGPVFRHKIRKTPVQKAEKHKREECEQDSEMENVLTMSGNRNIEKRKSEHTRKREDIREGFPQMVPHGSLGVDELAKLLC